MSKNEKPQISAEVLASWPKEAQDYLVALQTYFQTQLDELKTRLDQNSQNSSKPPSSDSPFKRGPKKAKAASEPGDGESRSRSRGGQPGHTRHLRALLPVEEVDELKEWWPSECQNCHGPLRPSDQLGQPHRQQVWEIPRTRATVTEHRMYECECSGCGQLTCSTSTTDQNQARPTGGFGPELVATIATLHGRYRLSMRETVELAADLWQVPLCVGAVADMCHKASLALKEPYEQIHTQIQASTESNVDETGWHEAGVRGWLWVAVTKMAVCFRVATSRSRAAFVALVGENYGGIVHSDRYNAYVALDAKRHQLCWAHLIRNLRGLGGRAGPAQEWAEKGLRLSEELFSLWHQFRQSEGGLSRQELNQKVAPIRAGFKSHLEIGQLLEDGKVQTFARQLLKHEERLWVFVSEPRIEPTNNRAERALRPAVIWRKTCFGTQSEKGSRFVERMLSVEATCQLQGHNFVDFLSQSLKAQWFAQPRPTLLSF